MHRILLIHLRVIHRLFLLLFLSSCSLSHKPYAPQTYWKQRSEESLPSQQDFSDEATIEELLINTEDSEKNISDEWERRQGENVSEWVERMEELLQENHDLFVIARKELRNLEREEKAYKEELKKIVIQKNLLEKWQDHPGKSLSMTRNASFDRKKKEKIKNMIPFTIHLVLSGETLYSIAMKYYNDPEKVKEIFLWNQGWIRSEGELLAGVGLILFFDDVSEKANQHTIETFINRMKRTENNES